MPFGSDDAEPVEDAFPIQNRTDRAQCRRQRKQRDLRLVLQEGSKWWERELLRAYRQHVVPNQSHIVTLIGPDGRTRPRIPAEIRILQTTLSDAS